MNKKQPTEQGNAVHYGQLKTMVNIRDEKIQSLLYENLKLKRLNLVYRSRIRSLEHDNFKLRHNLITAGGATIEDKSISGILKTIINKHYGICIDFRIRQRTVVTGRAMYYTLLRKYTDMSLKEMCATLACNPHHSTVIWALKSHEDLMKYEKKYQKSFKEISKLVEDAIIIEP